MDVESITDPVLLRATQDQIANFGQTPSQLLTKPHPPRLHPEDTFGGSHWLLAGSRSRVARSRSFRAFDLRGYGRFTEVKASALHGSDIGGGETDCLFIEYPVHTCYIRSVQTLVGERRLLQQCRGLAAHTCAVVSEPSLDLGQSAVGV